MTIVRRTRVPKAHRSQVVVAPTTSLVPDQSNPRQADPARLGLLRLSLAKLGFLMPVFRQKGTNLLLSGHQRLTVAKDLGMEFVPCMDVELSESEVKGVNILFNRITNDFNAFDTGSKAAGKLDMQTVIAAAEALPDKDLGEHAAFHCRDEPIAPIVRGTPELYDKKAALAAHTLLRKGIKIPAVVTESGRVVNGIHRLFSALESGVTTWPVVRVSDQIGDVASALLNYLSMDYKIDGEFKDLLRAGAFRRASNDKGTVPKSYRFWANGCRTLLDKDSYTPEAWNRFRHTHGQNILDFGAGLCKVAPYLQTKGMNAIDFEPYRFDPVKQSGQPDPDYSRAQAKRFLQLIADPKLKFDSIFLSAVMNSVPFPEDRLKVLAVVHALCSRNTAVYGTCRDISDYNYEYGGERRSVYFVMDGEPGVRLGDVTSRPKLQKFHTQAEARAMFERFWKTVEFWPGGNVFFYKLTHAMGINPRVLSQSLEFEFNLPYLDGSTMGLVDEAKAAFAKRLGISRLP